MNESAVRQEISQTCALLIRAKRNTLKRMSVELSPGSVIHPAYLQKKAMVSGTIRLDELLRGCLSAPVEVANGYWNIILEQYSCIRPKPTYRQLAAMFYGIMWNGIAYDLLRYTGVRIPEPYKWHDFRRSNLSEYLDPSQLPSAFILEPMSLYSTMQDILMLNLEQLPAFELHLMRRILLDEVLYQAIELDVEFITDSIKTILSLSMPVRFPAKWYRSTMHKSIANQLGTKYLNNSTPA